MSYQQPSRPQSRRPPLSDATSRTNNTNPQATQAGKIREDMSLHIPHHESLRPRGQLQIAPPASLVARSQVPSTQNRTGSPVSNTAKNRLSAISKESKAPESNRNSQISTASTNGSGGGRRKTHIGPWQLGKTLGKGATARVRLARHSKTGQSAAIKIVQKKNAQMTQAGSLASLDKRDVKLPAVSDGFRTMPFAIEREVAIMKLIDHPHIVGLLDIWENRTEIYLVLEHIPDGELFEHISANGRLDEEAAVHHFRQILSGMTYVHSLNICHRDLKPENILIDEHGDIRIADFGMAALRQTPTHMLKTACGSPHYAAPEVIRGNPYEGHKADTWSMGVILYAMLCGCLPFDNPDLEKLLASIKRGKYETPPHVGPEARDLLKRMLNLDASRRISTRDVWRHPLIRRYDYLDNLGGGALPRSPYAEEYRRPVTRRSEIDRDLLRHLRSMWHQIDETTIIKLLLNDEPNDQKLFYSLLVEHRAKQLEAYFPDINYSNSDYHHTQRPLSEIPKLSTRQFVKPKQKGHSRQVSRFTVVSNTSKGRQSGEYANTEAGETVHSYDPYNVSRPRHSAEPNAVSHAKVVVIRGRASLHEGTEGQTKHNRENDGFPRDGHSSLIRTRQGGLAAPRGYVTRSSLASSTRSRNSVPLVRVAMAHRRGVSFPHAMRNSGSDKLVAASSSKVKSDRHSKFSEVTDDGGSCLRAVTSPAASSRYVRNRKPGANSTSAPEMSPVKDRAGRMWQEEARKISSSLAKDCDEAFKIRPETDNINASYLHSSSLDPGESSRTSKRSSDRRSRDRPLPPPPSRSDSTRVELSEARRQAEELRLAGDGDLSPRHLQHMVSHIDRLLDTPTDRGAEGRRIASAPVHGTSEKYDRRHMLQAINETSLEDASPQRLTEYDQFLVNERLKATAQRVQSDPQPRSRRHAPVRAYTDQAGLRMVTDSPPKAPAPLNIRKRSQAGAEGSLMTGALDAGFSFPLGQRSDNSSRGDKTPQDDSFGTRSSSGTGKKTNWFSRKFAKSERDSTVRTQPSSNDSARPTSPVKDAASERRNTFSFTNPFKRRTLKDKLNAATFAIHEGDEMSLVSVDDDQNRSHADRQDDTKSRVVQAKQNWVHRLFRMKPPSKYLCFSGSKHRARREVVSILRGWRKYGVANVRVDKQRNLVFGEVLADNYLMVKPVHFACEIMTVIEHGKKSPLSIARFTQEKGAASSFQKVVDTLETVLKSRGMLVSDDRKKRMMIKTLESI